MTDASDRPELTEQVNIVIYSLLNKFKKKKENWGYINFKKE